MDQRLTVGQRSDHDDACDSGVKDKLNLHSLVAITAHPFARNGLLTRDERPWWTPLHLQPADGINGQSFTIVLVRGVCAFHGHFS